VERGKRGIGVKDMWVRGRLSLVRVRAAYALGKKWQGKKIPKPTEV